MIRAAAILQLLLGNIGRPAAASWLCAATPPSRARPTSRRSTTCCPATCHSRRATCTTRRLQEYLDAETPTTGWWHNLPRVHRQPAEGLVRRRRHAGERVRLRTGCRGSTADYSQQPMIAGHADGKIKGYFLPGQNPAGRRAQRGPHPRRRWRKLDWLVVRDSFETETAAFWYDSPEARRVIRRQIKTEVFFLPAAIAAEKDGTFTNTQRLIQWHDKAVDPPGDGRSEAWFYFHLGRRLKELYAESSRPEGPAASRRSPGTTPTDGTRLRRAGRRRASAGDQRLHLAGSAAASCQTSPTCRTTARPPAGAGSTAASTRPRGTTAPARPRRSRWIPHAPRLGLLLADQPPHPVQPGLGRPGRQPWSERKRYVGGTPSAAEWIGLDVPDFEPGQAARLSAGRPQRAREWTPTTATRPSS